MIYNERIYIGVGQDPEHGTGIGHYCCIDPAAKKGDISPDLVTDEKADPPKTKPNSKSGMIWHYGGEEKRPFARREYAFGRTMSTACIIDDVLYIAELDGYLHCLDSASGVDVAWALRPGGRNISSRPGPLRHRQCGAGYRHATASISARSIIVFIFIPLCCLVLPASQFLMVPGMECKQIEAAKPEEDGSGKSYSRSL